MNKTLSKLGLCVALAMGTMGQQALADTVIANGAKATTQGTQVNTNAETTGTSPTPFVVPANTVFHLHSVILSNSGSTAVNGVTIVRAGVNKTANITVPANSTIEITFPRGIRYPAGGNVEIGTTDTNPVNATFNGTISNR